MKHIFIPVICALLCSTLTLQGQNTPAAPATPAPPPAPEKVWKFGGGLGLDLAGLGLVNPRLGAGSNRIGLGGLVNLFANQKKGKTFWDNSGSLQLSTQRIGGSSAVFQKNVDILRLGSRFGYSILKEKLFFAVDGTAESQLLPTYVGNVIKGDEPDLLSHFLAPLRVQLSPGLDFKPNSKMSFFFAPVSLNLTYVGDDVLAALANQPLGNEAGKNNRTQLGYALKGQYTNKYFKDKMTFTSKFAWFADYRNNLNGNVLWQNAMSIAIFKGLSLDLFGDLFYDHFSQAIVEDVPAGTATADLGPYLGLKPSYTGGFLVKFNKIF